MECTDMERRILDMWPKFEDGEYVWIGDDVSGMDVRSFVFTESCVMVTNLTSVPAYGECRKYGEPLKRPAPKVLDADGVEIKVGDTVYDTELVNGDKFTVESIDKNGDVRARGGKCILTQSSVAFTHMQPAIDADGVLIEVGDKVWGIGDINPATVVEVDGDAVHVQYFDGFIFEHKAAQLSHERHDSWERLEEDAKKGNCEYLGRSQSSCDGCYLNGKSACDEYVRIDLIRRAKVLAEKEAAR